MEELISLLKDCVEKNGENDESVISISNQIASQIQETDDINEDFSQLPLTLIFKILEKVDFSQIYDVPNAVGTIVSKIVQAHVNEKEVLMLLQYINLSPETQFSKEECISILSCFKNCPLCVILETVNSLDKKAIDFDFDFELSKKEKEIAELRRQIEEKDKEIQELRSKLQSNDTTYDKPSVSSVDSHQQFPKPLIKKPFFYESDLTKAIQKGKLSSVQYTIEAHGLDVNMSNLEGKSLLEIARQYNQKEIEAYLLSKGAKEILISLRTEDSLTHAIKIDDLQSVSQMIGKNDFPNSSLEKYGLSPLLLAKIFHANNVYDYLKSHGAIMEHLTKIFLLGDSYAGKLSLLQRMLNKEWGTYGTIVGSTHDMLSVKTHNIKFNLDIWTFPGQAEYRRIISLYYRKLFETDIIFLCYDLTSIPSFNELDDFMDYLKESCEVKPKCMIVGLKSDLPNIQVTQEMVAQFIDKYSNEFTFIGSFKVSSYTRENLDTLINAVCDYFIQYYQLTDDI